MHEMLHFAKDLRDFKMNTINAKAEALMTSAMWRLPFTRRRCLVPADAFYEWKKLDAKTKQPYAFAMKSGEPLAFAGVWTRWMERDDKPLESYAIITTDPNELAASVHNRMPVILKPAGLSAMAYPRRHSAASNRPAATVRCGCDDNVESAQGRRQREKQPNGAAEQRLGVGKVAL